MQTHNPPMKMRWWLLKAYLRLHRWLHPRLIAKLAEPNFGGLHPSNVFHYRSRFFVENVAPQDRVVDIACGTGNIARALSAACAAVYAIDRSQANLAIATREHGAANIHYICADVLGYDYAGLAATQSVNVAVLSHILEHLEDACAFLQRLAMPRLLICVPSQENWRTQLLKHIGLPYFSCETHFREYTREMLLDELARAGYRARSLSYNPEGEIVCVADRIAAPGA